MTVSRWQDEFTGLAAEFLRGGRTRVCAMDGLLAALAGDPADAAARDELQRHFHRLRGAGATYGFDGISVLATEGERLCLLAELAQSAEPHCAALVAIVEQLKLSFEVSGPSPLAIERARAATSPAPHVPSHPQRRERADIVVAMAEPESLTALTTLLSQQEWTVRTATSCSAARRELDYQVPAGLVVDVSMPDGHGYDIVRQARELPGGEDTAIVVLSTSSEFVVLADAIHAGADACYEKPPDWEALTQRLNFLARPGGDAVPTVLVVEDDEAYAAFVKAVLEGAGYVVHVCVDPRLFAEALSAHRPDLIVMDIGLPQVSGYDLAKFVRQTDQFATLPIVFLTVHRALEARIRGARAGGDDHLVKPVHPSLLVASVAARRERSHYYRALLNRDGLTRLLTHTSFIEEAGALIERRRRDPAPATLVMIDIDHFKGINDSYGHQAGDRVLIALSGLFKRHLRRSDIIGRYGGEEFAILLDQLRVPDAQQLIERLLTEFHVTDQAAPDGQRYRVTFSAGVAALDPATMDVESWIRAADAALYGAKKAGRRQVRVHESASQPGTAA
jgi:diguanylate cyclase (GGDEF)-like protein